MQEESEKKHDNQFLKKKIKDEIKKNIKKYQIQLIPTFKIYGRVHGVNVVGIKGR